MSLAALFDGRKDRGRVSFKSVVHTEGGEEPAKTGLGWRRLRRRERIELCSPAEDMEHGIWTEEAAIGYNAAAVSRKQPLRFEVGCAGEVVNKFGS